jgi:hypothetical protein
MGFHPSLLSPVALPPAVLLLLPPLPPWLAPFLTVSLLTCRDIAGANPPIWTVIGAVVQAILPTNACIRCLHLSRMGSIPIFALLSCML